MLYIPLLELQRRGLWLWPHYGSHNYDTELQQWECNISIVISIISISDLFESFQCDNHFWISQPFCWSYNEVEYALFNVCYYLMFMQVMRCCIKNVRNSWASCSCPPTNDEWTPKDFHIIQWQCSVLLVYILTTQRSYHLIWSQHFWFCVVLVLGHHSLQCTNNTITLCTSWM